MHHNLLKLTALYFIAILLTILNLNSLTIVSDSTISLPLFEVMMIYYFSIHKDNIFSFWFIFLIGIWSDSLNGLPIGMTSLIYLLVIKISHVISQKQAPKEDFKAILQEFFIFISIVLVLKWIFLSIYYQNLYNIWPFVIQLAVTCVAYILMHRFFDFLSNRLSLDNY